MSAKSHISLIKTFIKKKPVYVHFGITHRCNLHCKMCNIWKSQKHRRELSLGQIEKLAGILNSLGVMYVSLGGGEPFLREDLPEIIRIFKRKGIKVRVLTNGVAPNKESIKKVIAAGLRDISVSLDSLNPQIQGYVCDSGNVWHKIMENIYMISGMFPKRGCLLLINTVVSRLNIEELPRLAQFADRLGYYISFVPFELPGITHCSLNYEDYDAEFKITDKEYGSVDKSYEALISKKRKNSRILNSSLFLENSRGFLKSGRVNWQCDAGRLYFSVNPEGRFSICHRFDPIDCFDLDYINSSQFQSKRDELVKNCPGCMRPCWAEISYLMKDRKSFWEMAKVHISTLKKRKIPPYEEIFRKTEDP